MVEDFGVFVGAVLKVLQVEFTLYGFTFSFWQVFLWVAVVSAVALVLGVIYHG